MSETLRLNRHPDLRDFQGYVRQAAERNGSEVQDPTDGLLLLSTQVGRLAKAIRVDAGLTLHVGSERPKVADELAGLLYYVVYAANYFGIDLEEAFRDREKRFRRRKSRER